MKRTLSFLLFATASASLVGGCGAPATDPAPAAQQPKITVEPKATVVSVTPGNAEPDGDPESHPGASDDAKRIARQAEQHAKAIEQLLAARAKEDKNRPGVRVIEPEFSDAAPSIDPGPVAVAKSQMNSEPVAPKVEASPTVAVSETPKVDPFDPVQVTGATSSNTAVSVAAVAPSAEPKTAVVARPPEVDAPKAGESHEQQLARRAREYPRDLVSQFDYQLALFLKGETVPRVADIAQLPTEDRETLTALMDGLFNFRAGISADSNMLMNRKIRPLIEMSDRLRSRADLAIPTATLCREVKGYGLYTPIEPLRFEAGIAHKVIVYSEVENFSSQMNDKNMWQTKLQQSLVLYTETGLPVWETKESLTDECRNRRRDFYTVKIIQLPPNLNMGRYVLKVSVTDEQAQRIAETSIPVAVVAK